MNTQEAYRQLDLAIGLDLDRVQSQYYVLKTALSEKISGTSNAVLKEVYQKRLEEVEEAYAVLTKHFNHDVNEDVPGEDNGSSFTEDNYTVVHTQVKNSAKSNKKRIAIIGSGIVVLTALLFAFFVFQSKLDPFRTLEGEEQIFVSRLKLREYPSTDSSEKGSYPTGTRFVYDRTVAPVNRAPYTWRKVNICHPDHGWGTEEEPFRYSGWMATSECGIQWVEDSVKTQQLLQIFEKGEYHPAIRASFRHAIVDYFLEKGYIDKWFVPAKIKESSYSTVVTLKHDNNLSKPNCEGKNPGDLFVIIRSIKGTNQKILLMTVNNNGMAYVRREFPFDGENFDLKSSGKTRILLQRDYRKARSQASEIFFQKSRNYYILY